MTSQVIFKMDKKLKDQAMKKAKSEGISFSTILRIATKDYVNNLLDIRVERIENFNAKTQREIKQALKEIKAGKGLSPRFDNAKDAIAWLKSDNKKWS